jgi:transposase-like protein
LVELLLQLPDLYRAIDRNGDTVEFWFSERRNLTAAKRFLRKALKRHDQPERIVIDGSHTNREAILACDMTDGLVTDQGARSRSVSFSFEPRPRHLPSANL